VLSFLNHIYIIIYIYVYTHYIYMHYIIYITIYIYIITFGTSSDCRLADLAVESSSKQEVQQWLVSDSTQRSSCSAVCTYDKPLVDLLKTRATAVATSAEAWTWGCNMNLLVSLFDSDSQKTSPKHIQTYYRTHTKGGASRSSRVSAKRGVNDGPPQCPSMRLKQVVQGDH
jgi:hypothetical protein